MQLGACHAPDDASQGEPHHRVGLTPDCRTASGNKPQAPGGNGRLGLCPMCEGCNRRCSASRPQHDAKNETQPRLARRHRKLKGPTDTPKYVALGDTAGVANVNSRFQRGNLHFVLLFLALQSPQPGAHDLTGVFVTTGLNFFSDETIKLVGQIDVSRRHDRDPPHRCKLGVHCNTTGKDCQYSHLSVYWGNSGPPHTSSRCCGGAQDALTCWDGNLECASMTEHSAPLGQTVSHYRILEKLGGG